MSDGRYGFHFALIHENPKARTVCFYIAKPTKLRGTCMVHNAHKE